MNILALFKAWTTPEDLIENYSTWSEVLNLFLNGLIDNRIRNIINNIDLIHRCKQENDISRSRHTSSGQSVALTSNDNGHFDDSDSEVEQLEDCDHDFLGKILHLNSTDDLNFMTTMNPAFQQYTDSALKAARNAGRFGHNFNNFEEMRSTCATLAANKRIELNKLVDWKSSLLQACMMAQIQTQSRPM